MHIQVKMKKNFSLILIYIRVENTLRVLIPPLTQIRGEMAHKDFIITIISTYVSYYKKLLSGSHYASF